VVTRLVHGCTQIIVTIQSANLSKAQIYSAIKQILKLKFETATLYVPHVSFSRKLCAASRFFSTFKWVLNGYQTMKL
jgi:hypothetical protein